MRLRSMCIDKLENKIHRLYNNRLNEEWRGTHIMRGRIPDSQSIQLVSNDYLSLANHPEILKAQEKGRQNRPQLEK